MEKLQGMVALKSEYEFSQHNVGQDAPVDLVYLSSLTMGDVSLEVEILRMFVAQLPTYLNALSSCNNEEEKRVALHTLKGAARSVGALKLSEVAKNMEDDLTTSPNVLIAEAARVAYFIDNISR